MSSSQPEAGSGRRLAVRLAVVLASVAIAAALVAGYVQRAAVNSGQFANRATAALRDESVRGFVAERITDEVILKRQADLLAARPIIQSAVSGIIGSRAFTRLFRSAVRDVHRAVFDQDRHTVTLTVADVGTVVAAAVEKLRPSLARDVAATGQVEILKRDLGSAGAALARLPHRVRVLALLLVVGSLLLVAVAVTLSADRRRTVVELGVGTAAGGVLLVVALGVARSAVVQHVQGPDGQAAARAVWDAFLGDLHTAAWILAGCGAVVAAAAGSLLKPFDIREPMRRAGRWLGTEPRRPALRVLRALALVAAGVVVLTERDAVVALLLTTVGVYLIYEGVSVLLRLVYRPTARTRVSASAPSRRRRRIATACVAAVLIVAAAATFVGSGGVTTAAPAAGPCNGHEALCHRPLDEVTLAATHNAMAVPSAGWFAAEQDAPIPDQLRAGVRGLLIDTYYADRLPNGKLRTVLPATKELRQRAAQDGVSPDAVDAALRIRDRLGFSGQGERGMYLCHTFCEIGATPLAPVLRELHDFLVTNPNEVVVVINQDYVTPADFVAAVDDAGLGPFVYRGPVSGTWHTLRQMIDSGQRIVFLAENKAGGAPWYHPVYDGITEETPYTFPRVAQLTDPAKLPPGCRPNRGSSGSPLFLVNHWISTDPTPRPSDAEKVNAYGPLLARVRECERLRKHRANLVAVNFYRRGDVFRVVDTLNGARQR